MALLKKRESTLRLLHEEVPAPMREAYNRIRVNLLARAGMGVERAGGDACPVIGVTDVVSHPGQPYLAANLAISFAQLGLRTLLIDADYRAREDLAALFGVDGGKGLAGYTAGMPIAPAFVGVSTLSFLGRGEAMGNPADLVGNNVFFSSVSALRAEYDVIFLSLPPMTAYADAATAAPALSGMVLGTVPGVDKRSAVSAAIETLENVGLPLYGMVACEE